MQGKRAKRHPLAMLAVAALILLMLWLTASRLVFVVRNVGVEGNSRLSAEDVIRISGIPMSEYLGDLDKTEISDRVLKDGRAKLLDMRFELPDGIVLTVEERTPAVIIAAAGCIVVMDEECVVIEAASAVPDASVLYVSGIDIGNIIAGTTIKADEEKIGAICRVASALRKLNAVEHISELNVENTEALYLYSKDSTKILLGDAENMDAKIAWVVSAVRDLETRGEKRGTLDVSSGSMADYQPEQD